MKVHDVDVVCNECGSTDIHTQQDADEAWPRKIEGKWSMSTLDRTARQSIKERIAVINETSMCEKAQQASSGATAVCQRMHALGGAVFLGKARKAVADDIALDIDAVIELLKDVKRELVA
jgi:hypothetical protein